MIRNAQKTWLYLFAIILLAMSAFSILGSNRSPLNPLPFYFYFLVIFISYFSLFVMPVLYLAQIWLLNKAKRLSEIVLILTVGLAVLNFLHIVIAYKYGLVYRGSIYMHIVIFENIVIFLMAFSLAIYGLLKRSEFASNLAILFLFIALSWCAFPYVGEMA